MVVWLVMPPNAYLRITESRLCQTEAGSPCFCMRLIIELITLRKSSPGDFSFNAVRNESHAAPNASLNCGCAASCSVTPAALSRARNAASRLFSSLPVFATSRGAAAACLTCSGRHPHDQRMSNCVGVTIFRWTVPPLIRFSRVSSACFPAV